MWKLKPYQNGILSVLNWQWLQNGRRDNVRYVVGINKTTLGNEISYKTKMNQDVECNWPAGIFGAKKGKKSY